MPSVGAEKQSHGEVLYPGLPEDLPSATPYSCHIPQKTPSPKLNTSIRGNCPLSTMLVPSMGMGILQNPERYQVGTVPPAAPRGKCKTHLSTTANRKGVRGRGAEGQEEKSSQSSCRALHGAVGHGHGKQGWSQLAYGLCSAQCSAPAALPLFSPGHWACTGCQGKNMNV